MRISDLLSLSFENLRRRKGRTTLTIIGVIVGTCSIVVMVSLGIAMNVGFDEMISQWGDLTQIQVYNWGGSNSDVPKLDDKMVAELDALEHVKVATPIYNARYLNAQIFAGKGDRYVMDAYNIVGIYPEAIKELEYELISGKYLDEAAVSGKKLPVLVGQYAGYGFTDSKKRGEKAYRWQGQTDAQGNPLDPFVDVNKDKLTLKTVKQEDNSKQITYELQVTGVMLEDYKKGYVTSQGIVMDLNTLKRLEKEYMKANGIKDANYDKQGYDNIYVKVDDVDNVEAVEKAIQDYGYDTYSMSSERDRMREQSQMIQMILGGLGAVSLFVAALSIANTMTMAIYERTREIGVMKVLGCKLGKIRQMFLLEAAMIGFVGGVLGVGISYTLSFLMNHFGPMLQNVLGSILPMYGSKMSVIPPWLALVGILFSTGIGILSGIMPANRAVKISALEAIRHE
ncbi:ABC transporter permease [Anaerofilum sp. BX8]|uniref:ABC transporter permease n=1 Tax=Anaerofilum hominis TaxID=2763016 RepID=A0A923L1Q2_9FIRM|nr:ABC transporter permease [Anaerofilum hominis]MBC5582239.1 ABC transporter permease [Anaerofilum hominis]